MSTRLPTDLVQKAKAAMRTGLKVDESISIGGCVVCSPSAKLPQVWYSAAGQKEYRITGICERCYDEHAADAFEHCQLFTECGKLLASLWVVVGRCRGEMSCHSSVARALVAMAQGDFDLASMDLRVELQRRGSLHPHVRLPGSVSTQWRRSAA